MGFIPRFCPRPTRFSGPAEHCVSRQNRDGGSFDPDSGVVGNIRCSSTGHALRCHEPQPLEWRNLWFKRNP